jgi:cell division protein FtsQ
VPSQPIPRLAQIKLAGGAEGDQIRVTGRSLMLGLTGAIMFFGISVAGASFLGSSLFDVREATARATDAAAADMGFSLNDVAVREMPDTPPLSAARVDEVRTLLSESDRRSVLAADPALVRARVEGLDWVASARVRRLWPEGILVEIERRQEIALWREDGETSVIDINGERLLSARAADFPDLPLVVGAGAGPAAEGVLATLDGLPDVRDRMRALVRINDRRWNLELKTGTVVALPEADPATALAQLQRLQEDYALLDRPVSRIDMRVPGRMAVRVEPALAGARYSVAGDA